MSSSPISVLGTLIKVMKDHDSRPADFDQLFASLLAKRKKQVVRLRDDHRTLLQHIQADEWQAIIDRAKAEMEKAADFRILAAR